MFLFTCHIHNMATNLIHYGNYLYTSLYKNIFLYKQMPMLPFR